MCCVSCKTAHTGSFLLFPCTSCPLQIKDKLRSLKNKYLAWSHLTLKGRKSFKQGSLLYLDPSTELKQNSGQSFISHPTPGLFPYLPFEKGGVDDL